jgi:DNA-binding beta-propeller fold protein YncE
VLIYGTGAGPEVVFSPATLSTLGGGFSNPYGVAVDGSGNVYVTDESTISLVKVMPPAALHRAA